MTASSRARSILWRGTDPFSAELLAVSERDDGWELLGTAVVALPEGGVVVRYSVALDDAWRSRRVDVELSGAREATLRMAADGNGSWTIDGRPAGGLDGCIDVDLGVSPATNTLPIRRLRPDIGETVTTRVAWVRFPELTVEPDDQTYERTGERTWTFRSDDFRAELEVDEEALVVTYADLWSAVTSVDH
ncbi:MAG TPA: putative glycolipid-binding domain-containing protein [Actinomycetota bacterium]|jgi:hypothetical protein|nr:putative glycolipid-binding domain-containing protein [Actinomycetota bacterium]